MTTKEKLQLAGAVERMRGTEGPTFHGVEGKRHISEREYSDAITLAMAYLAEHPADADDPIDVDWLKAGGWEHSNDEGEDVWVICSESLIPVFSLEHDPASLCNSGYIGEYQDGDDWPQDIWTRGQLRDICRALGAPLPN